MDLSRRGPLAVAGEEGAAAEGGSRRHGRHTMRKTTPQLITEINESIREFSLALRPLAVDAGRRLTDGERGDSLKKAFSYATHILAYIEDEKPK
jgi:hypothetical protein